MTPTSDPSFDPAFRLMFESNPLPMYVYDVATLFFIEVNRVAVEQYGYTRQELLTLKITDIRPAEDLPRLRAALDELPDAPASAVRRHASAWKHRLKDGRIRDVDIVSSPIDFAGRRAALVVATDVTELKQAQDALGKYARRLDILHEIDRAVIAAEAPVAIAEAALRRLRELLDVPRAIVNLFDLAAGEVEWLAAVGRRRVHRGPGVRFSLELMGDVEALRRGELQVIDVDALPRPGGGGAPRLRRPHLHGYVSADRQRLQQVLLNLLSNAVKYNRDRGRVRVACELGGAGRLRLAVSDTGPGIAPDKLDRLFTPFDRLGAEQTGIDGTGLGLALSKRLVEAMGGAIDVQSGQEGTAFTIELDACEGLAAPVMPAGVDVADRLPGVPATVLYIEDNVANLRLLERIIRRRPAITLLSAMQGSQGVELARAHRPQAIILDLHLPDLSGEEVLVRLRDDPRTRDIPVVILSADATPGQVSRLRAQGARAYLTKPLDLNELLSLLDEILSERSTPR